MHFQSMSAWQEKLQGFLTKYKCDLPSPSTLVQELSMWYLKWKSARDEVKELKEAYLYAIQSIQYPNISHLLKILLTIPVTSASTERANSTIKYIKASLRSTMTQQTLNCLVLGYKHKDLLAQLKENELVDIFIRMKRRRLLLGNPVSE